VLHPVPEAPEADFCKSEVVFSATTHGKSNFSSKYVYFFVYVCAEAGFLLGTYMNLGLRSPPYSS
jgi:hypothetical protein